MTDDVLSILIFYRYPVVFLALSFFSISYFWKEIFSYFKLKKYNNVQRVHIDEVSRLGGFIIYIYFWVLLFFNIQEDLFFKNLLISSVPLFFIALKEDIFHNTEPKIRLLFMILGCFIFLFLNPINLPIIDFPFFRNLFEIYPVGIIFFIFCVLVVMNGMNLIDGMNGLFGLTAVFQLLTLAVMSYSLEDNHVFNLSITFIIPLIVFLIFNIPCAKLFIGDSGAYLFGFLISFLLIYFFGKNPKLLSWSAVLILYYPCMELLFSFIRKKLNYKNPFYADSFHLHSIIYKKFASLKKNSNFSNFLTTLSLFIFWFIPSFSVIFVYKNIIFIYILILFLTIFYCLLYYFIKKFIGASK